MNTNPVPEENHKHAVCFGILAIILSMGVGRFAFTPLLPIMQNSLGFGEDVAGTLAGANYLGYLIGALLCPFLLTQPHRVLFYRSCLVLMFFSLITMPMVDNYLMWGGLRFFAGVSSAGIFILASSSILNVLAYKKKTELFGLMYSGVGLGIILTGVLIHTMQMQFSWQQIWTALALISLVLIIPCYGYALPITKAVEPTQHIAQANFPLNILYIAYFMEGLGYSVAATFLVRMVSLTQGLEDIANFTWIIVGIAGIPSTILWSHYAKRNTLTKAIMLAFLIQAIGLMLPALWNTRWAVIGCAICFGGTFIAIVNLTLALGREIKPQQSQKIISKLTIFFGIGQIIGPVIAGIVAQKTQTYAIAFATSSLVVLIGAGLIYLGQKKGQVLKPETC